MILRDDGPIRYILEGERGTAKPSVFILRPDDKDFQVKLETVAERKLEAEKRGEPWSWGWEYLKLGLLDWENVTDAKGQPVEIQLDADGFAADESIRRIPFKYRTEIANAIAGVGDLTETDRKNSGSPSSSTSD